MIYIKMHGRLGNQFFQYAYARTLAKERHDTITMDFTNIEEEARIDPNGNWENSLQHYQIMPETRVGKAKHTLQQLLAMQFRKHGFRTYRQFNKADDAERVFNEKIIDKMAAKGILMATDYHKYRNLPAGDLILDGYFECPAYFESCRDIIYEEFVPKYPLKDENKKLYEYICEHNTICVTIRRGDFVYKEGVAKAANICTKEYFYNGIQYIRNKYPDAQVVVFSDEVPWVREHMQFPAGTCYESGHDPVWEKMRLMSACKHFVISNSTFSWWAQYLGKAPDKIVVAPNKWRRDGIEGRDLYEPDWVLLPV